MVASRFSVGLIRPVTYIGLRMLFASLGFFIVYAFRLRGKGFPRGKRLWFQASLLALFGTLIPMLLIISSLRFQSSGITSILITASPAITLLMAHWFLRNERLTKNRGFGIVLALGGALLLALRGESGLPDLSSANPLGYGMVLVAMISSSVMIIYVRRYMSGSDVFDVSGARIFVSALIMVPWMFFFVTDDLLALNWIGWAAVLYAAVVGTFFGILLDFYNIKHFGATASALVSYILPIITGIFGVLLLGETITSGMIVGMFLILSGVWLINSRR